MSDGKFFTFPLCLLALPMPEEQIMQHIVSHSTERAGKASGDEFDQDRIAEHLATHGNQGYNRTKRHMQLVCGAITCNVNLGSLPGAVGRCDTAQGFIDAHEARYDRDALVFIGADLLWACNNNNDLPFRLFSLLCAVNSIISYKRKPILIRREMLIARQLGFKTPDVMRAAIGPDRKPLSTQQLRDALDALENRDLIRRCRASPRNVYFSTLLTADELRDAVKALVERKSKVQERRELDRKAMGTTTEPLKNGEPKESHTRTETGTVSGTKTGTTKTNAFKEMLLKEEPPNKSLQINEEMGGPLSASPFPKEDRFQPPTLVEVEDFAKTLHKQATPDLAAQWFANHSAAAEWANRDWRKAFASWLFDAIARNRRTSDDA